VDGAKEHWALPKELIRTTQYSVLCATLGGRIFVESHFTVQLQCMHAA
jgi:hypothetical protein